MAIKPVVVNQRSLLEAALVGLEIQKANIEAQIREVQQSLGTRVAAPAKQAPAPAAAAPKTKRTLSAAARKRIAEAQKRRWAAYRKNESGKN
jgi:hypothetical protein